MIERPVKREGYTFRILRVISEGRGGRGAREIDERVFGHLGRGSKMAVYVYLYRMEKRGIIRSEGRRKKRRYFITEKGKLILKHRRNIRRFDRYREIERQKRRTAFELRHPLRGRRIFITYDIPAIMNYHRDRFREYLKMQGFKIVHRSMWSIEYNRDGKRRLKEALRYAKELGLQNLVGYGLCQGIGALI